MGYVQPTHERSSRHRRCWSASTSAAPSPTCSCSTRRAAARASSRCRRRAARKRAASCTAWQRIGAAAGDIATVVHGTTVGTNALLERKVARTGIITTRGFRDVLEMRRRDRPATWGLRGGFVPVVPRDLRLEVDERVLADGTRARSRSTWTQVRAAARAAARSRLRGGVRLLHQHLRQRRTTSRPPRGGARAVAERARHRRQPRC